MTLAGNPQTRIHERRPCHLAMLLSIGVSIQSSMAAEKRARVETIDDYLAAVPDDARGALNKLRKAIKAAAPMATEVISYQVPAFKHNGLLVGFGASKDHCTFYVMSTEVTRAHAGELKKYETGKGSIRFPASKPLPVALVTKLVKARIAENEKNKVDR